MTKPYPFQLEGVERMEAFNGRALLADQMGLGKTIQALLFAQRNSKLPIVVVCPASLKENWKREAAKHVRMPAVILSGTKPNVDPKFLVSPILIINYDILEPWLPFLRSLDPKLVICDECFPGDTKVQTEYGPMAIQTIVENRLSIKVQSINCKTGSIDIKPITHYFKIRRTRKMVTIRHSLGKLMCTENHPIWTRNRGYVEAQHLTRNDLLILRKDVSTSLQNQKVLLNELLESGEKKTTENHQMPMVQKGISSNSLPREKTTVLQSHLCQSLHDISAIQPGKIHTGMEGQNPNKQRSISENKRRKSVSQKKLRKNAGKKSNVQRGDCSKNEADKDIQQNFPPMPNSQRRERQANSTTKETVPQTEPDHTLLMENGACYKNNLSANGWAANSIQSRHSLPRTEDSHRSRREIPQNEKVERTGCQEGNLLEIVRVEDVQIHKPACNGEADFHSKSNQFVYCIEVEGNHNFFADGILVSNCHYLQGRNTKRTKAVQRLCYGVPGFLALTGTPLTNRPANLWPILNVINPRLYPSFWNYAREFCNLKRTPWGWDWNGASNLPKLHQTLLKHCMIRRKKEDVLSQLPPMQRIVMPVEITDRRQYETATKDFMSWMLQYSPTSLKTAQKAEGLVKIGYLLRLTATLKLPIIREWIDNFLEGSDEKLTVYGIHRKIVESLHETYGKVSVLVHGGITGGNRQRAVDQFQRDKKTRLFIGNVKAAGVGLTLTAAATVANIEFGWVPGDHIQAEARILRIGQTKNCTSYWIVGQDTIEERLVKVLQTKQQNIDAVVDGDDEVNQLDVYDQLIDELRKDSHEKRSRPTTKNPPKTRRR